MRSFILSAVLGLVLLNAYDVAAVRVAIPLQPPSDATPIAPDHVSFSIEKDRWLDWVGTTSRNEFFYNALDNLVQSAGVPPRIRVGGKTQDATSMGPPSLEFANVAIINSYINATTPYPAAVGLSVAEGFYRTAKFLPKNTRVIHGLNYVSSDDLRGYYHLAAIAKAFTSTDVVNAGVVLDAIEIGNEPDLYPRDALSSEPYPYNSTVFVRHWNQWANNALMALETSPNLNISLWGASLSRSSYSTEGWSPQALFGQGLLSATRGAGTLISTISQHHYAGGSVCSGNSSLLQNLMKKSNIRRSLDPFLPDIAATRAQGLEYVLGEANSFSCHGAAGVSNVAGAALWALDYLLYASQIGISRVFFHQGIGWRFNLIQPATLPRSPLDATPFSPPRSAYVQPQYYAAIIAAEAIGSSGNTRIVELPVRDSQISGYAIYEGGALARAVFINSSPWFSENSVQTQTRKVTHIDLSYITDLESGPIAMTVKRLSIPSADATSGLTWGGLSYETDDARPAGAADINSVDLSSGLDIQATEAVLLSFK